MATNSVGTIRSRDCEVRAVIPQSYNIQVYGEYAIIGNTGHLKCTIPAFVREFVRVTAWLKGDEIIATLSSPKDSKHIILDNGDLLIRNVTKMDNGYYKCQTKHELSNEIIVSSIEGHFIVNDVITGVSPRITSQSPIKANVDQNVELLCLTKAWPQATVRWFQASDSGLITPIRTTDNIHIYDSVLLIDNVQEQHSGNWICIANNSLGEERSYIELYVKHPIEVNISPEYLLADLQSTATFICNISYGQPLSIIWLKDGQTIFSSMSMSTVTTNLNNLNNDNNNNDRIRLIESHILNIRSVRSEDSGCYQCLVQTDEYNIQASGILKLGDSPPIFIETFTDGLIYEQGSFISLKCSASSTLLPQIRWYLDEQTLDGYSPRRVTMGDYVKTTGHLVSFLNITNAKVIDGGQYRCTASNNAGIVNYSGRINIIGPATLRNNWLTTAQSSTKNNDYTITVISGTTVTLICPVIGYPIESILWKHRSLTLPNNHRQKIEPIIAGVGGRLTISNVHRDNDQGDYECIVKGTDLKAIRGIIKIIVRVAPLIDQQLISKKTIATEGMKVKLMCSVLEGDTPLFIKWFKHSDNNLNDQQNKLIPVKTNHQLSIYVQEEEDSYSLLTFRSVSHKHNGNWTCKVWNDIQTVNRTTTLIVQQSPKWSIEPNKENYVIVGNNILINCLADGNPKPKILWKKSITLDNDLLINDEFNNINNNGDNDNIEQQKHPSDFKELLSTYRRQIYSNGTLMIQEVDKTDAGYYMCQISNGIGAGLSKLIELIVQSPPYFATKFLSKSVIKSETALLECQVQGDPILHIHWYKDRSLIHHSSSSSTIESSNQSNVIQHTINDKRYTIKQDIISAQKVISFLQIDNVDRQDSTIYTCVANNNFGSDNTSVQLIVQEVPDAPTNVELLEITSRTVQIQWKSSYSGNSPLLKYHIQYHRINCSYIINNKQQKQDEQKFWNELSTQSGQELRITIKGLMPNCYYEIKICSENQIGRSEFTTNPIVVKTLEEVPGGPPTDVQVETTSSTSLKIKWRPPIPSVQFGRIRGYYIGYKVFGSDDPFQYKNVDVVNDDPSTSPAAINDQSVSYITNLKRKTTYVVILQAYNSVGPGPRTEEIKISTFAQQPPTSPLLEIVTTTYDAILLKWDSSFQQQLEQQEQQEIKEKEYVLYYREDHNQAQQKSSIEWYQKRIYTKSNQFVLNKENSQGRIRCGTKYHLYMTATNSLGTGEPSETVIAKTKGDTPLAPSRSDFIVANSTTAILSLKSWQTRGCSIQAFTIQYKPIQQKQWIPLVEYLEVRDYFYVYHLSPNRDYQLLVSAHCEPGITRQEYTFHTPNDSAIVRLHGNVHGLLASASPMDQYTLHGTTSTTTTTSTATSMTNVHLRNFTVLLPVLISLMVLIIILATLFGCLRRQHVNHVVNSIDSRHHGGTTTIRSDLCVEHLTRFNADNNVNNTKEGILLLNGGRHDSIECYPMTEFCPTTNPNNTESSIINTTTNTNNGAPSSCTNSSCDSKSNLLLNGNLTTTNNNNSNNNNGDLFATSPRHHHHHHHIHHLGSIYNDNGATNKFSTLTCNQLKLLQNKTTVATNQSYYSSPQRKSTILNSVVLNNNCLLQSHRSDHEYAEPLQTATNIVRLNDSTTIFVVDNNDGNGNNQNDNHQNDNCIIADNQQQHCQLLNNNDNDYLQQQQSSQQSQSQSQQHQLIDKQQPYLLD